MSVPVLTATGIAKSYGGVRVLDDVSVDLRQGEVHALVGENGAGKSTLIKILGGAVRADSGEVRVEDHLLAPGDPLAARRAGVSLVYQEFTLVPELSVADNVFLGHELGRPFLERPAMARRAQMLLDELGIQVRASARVAGLSVAQQQMVEIARALGRDAKVLILDEPTASLSVREVDRLLGLLRQLRSRGLGLLYISHRFEEIFALADRVTVLRDGRKIETSNVAGLDRAQLIRWMVGRDVSEEFPARDASPGPPTLAVTRLSAPPRFSDVSLSVRRGEIVGLAGLVGAGRTSVGLAIAGALAARGDIQVSGAPAGFRTPADALRHGVAYLTEDRKGRGVFPLMSARANITIAALHKFTRAGWLAPAREARAAATAASGVDVRVANLSQPASTLSGGNQQKLLIARYLLRRPALVILDEPTRGVDVGARADIYGLMNRLTAEGLAILMISSDLPELLGMSDRVVVMREGRVTGELARGAATPEAVMALATTAG